MIISWEGESESIVMNIKANVNINKRKQQALKLN